MPRGTIGLLLTEEDLSPETIDWGRAQMAALATAPAEAGRSAVVTAFKTGALADAATRAAAHFSLSSTSLAALDAASLRDWMTRHALDAIVTPHAPVGPTRTAIDAARTAGVPITMIRRDYDSIAWPHATRGFFPFKERIGEIIGELATA